MTSQEFKNAMLKFSCASVTQLKSGQVKSINPKDIEKVFYHD